MSFAQRVANVVYRILGPVLRAHEDRIMAATSQMLADRSSPPAQRGIVLPGSYDPTDGTVEVLIGSTYGLIGDDGDLPATLKKVPLLTPMVGNLAAPIGGERVTLYRDFGAILHHGPDDSPGTATNGSPGVTPGEWIVAHRNPTTLAYDSYQHLTNDGSTPGDGLGGTRALAGAYMQTFTAGGHAITADDTVRYLAMISAGGIVHKLDDELNRLTHSVNVAGGTLVEHILDGAANTLTHSVAAGGGAFVRHLLNGAANTLTHQAGPAYVLFDGAGNEISHVATKVALGDLAANLAPLNALVLKTHLDAFQSSLLTQRLGDQIKLVNLLNGVGTMTGAQLTAALASLVTGFLPGITVPAGSATVFAKI